MGSKKTNNSTSTVTTDTHLSGKKNKNPLLKKILIWVLAVVIILFLIGMVVYNYLYDNGTFDRQVVALETENYSVNKSDMSYFFYSTYQNVISAYTSYGIDLSTLGIDTTKSLRTQQCTFADNQTWYEYFMAQSKASASSLLTLCEAAKEAGIALDDDDQATIDSSLSSLADAAKTAGYSKADYIHRLYGTIVNESDLRHCLELSQLAAKYLEKCGDDVDISDEVLEAKYAESPETYDKASYIKYAFDYSDLMPKEETDESETADTSADTTAETEAEKEEDPALKAEAIETSKKYAYELAECTDEESFKAYILKNMTEVLGLTEEEADQQWSNMIVKNASYSTSSDEMTWVFSAEKNETKVFEGADDKEGIFTVYMVTAPRGRDESISSRDVRHILFKKETYEDDTKANEVYDAWVANGATEEEFIKLAAEYSEDPGSASNGGLYEGVTEGQMVDEFNDWLFDEARVPGDHAVVATESYGWHIMYYVGGMEGWKAAIISDLKTAAQEKAETDASEKYEVTSYDDVINSISA